MSEMDQGNTVAPEHRTVTPEPHTPTPWAVMSSDEWHDMNSGNAPSSVFHIGDYTVVTDSPSYEFHEADSADAAFIVRAANSHDSLVKACEAALDYLYEIADSDENPDEWDLTKQLVAALSAAKGET